MIDFNLPLRAFFRRAMVCQAVLLAIPRDLEQRMTYLIEPFPPNIRFSLSCMLVDYLLCRIRTNISGLRSLRCNS